MGTAELAEAFGAVFGCGEQAKAAGLYHDIGKYSAEFQKRLLGAEIRVDHSTAGMQEMLKLNQLEIAFAIAGHHGGLPDGGSRFDDDGASLYSRGRRKVCDYGGWQSEAVSPLIPPPPDFCGDRFAQSFYIRMLFSCLVDADFLDTESFMNGAPLPRGEFETPEKLLEKTRARAKSLLSAPPGKAINEIRNKILQACIDSGKESERGLFTLTVPTGGGKTFASLAFALEHAVKNSMDRVIYVVPYTSIIDQTVEKFREILGAKNVLAHYSGADCFSKDEEDLSADEYRLLLASENWDAPVIVTSAVQFFESLFANRPAKCRKLHNIANSVLIFDEAQTLPNDYLRPCSAAMAQLIMHYRCSAVLCTATQPALDGLFAEFTPGYKIHEICKTELDLYKALKRTSLKMLGTISADSLSAMLCENSQILCVVNRRKTAQELYKRLPEEGRYCLTTLLCPQDRKKKLTEIRQRLSDGLPCRVVSTSLIEAGVDVDFPAALREETGLDSVLQTAGRCNREGRNTAADSFVYIFSLEGSPVLPMLTKNRDLFVSTAERFPSLLDSPEAIRSYFENLIYLKGNQALDKKGILPAFRKSLNGSVLPFRQVSEIFRIIENDTRTVYIPIGAGEEYCTALRYGKASRSLYRKLGEYSVSIYPQHYKLLYDAGALEQLPDGSAILTDLTQYSADTGLKMDVETGIGHYV